MLDIDASRFTLICFYCVASHLETLILVCAEGRSSQDEWLFCMVSVVKVWEFDIFARKYAKKARHCFLNEAIPSYIDYEYWPPPSLR
jgi:hypothetical protein